MDEKRKEKRLEDDNEIAVTVFADGKKFTREKFFYNYTKDISTSGAKFQSNIFLPVDTLLKMDIKLRNLQQFITAAGRVKWIRSIFDDEYFDAGVAFVDTPKEEIRKLSDYLSLKQNVSVLRPF